MPITPTNPFKGRQFPGEVIILCVRWYLRYPLAYEHVAELLAERGVAVDPSCIWRWVQAYAPELDKRCRPYLKSTNRTVLWLGQYRTGNLIALSAPNTLGSGVLFTTLRRPIRRGRHSARA